MDEVALISTPFGYSIVTWILGSLLSVAGLMLAILWLGWRLQRPNLSLSLYSTLPLRRATDISYSSRQKVQDFIAQLGEYENQKIDFSKAAVCRETGRIFPDCVSFFGKIKLDWTFIQKRCPGDYVSWGSLTYDQQRDIRNEHGGSLEGFQTELSSVRPSPRDVEIVYAMSKPGPLYVDLNTRIVVGWKCVPHSLLEVLVVEKPKQRFYM